MPENGGRGGFYARPTKSLGMGLKRIVKQMVFSDREMGMAAEGSSILIKRRR